MLSVCANIEIKADLDRLEWNLPLHKVPILDVAHPLVDDPKHRNLLAISLEMLEGEPGIPLMLISWLVV